MHDLDISKYYVWPAYDRILERVAENSSELVCKLYIAPKYLELAFGKGKLNY